MTSSITRRSVILAFAASCAALGSGPSLAQTSKAPQVKFTTNVGEFVVELYPDKAPATVQNFIQYVKDKHYDGTIFHRVIPGFMIQGGGFDSQYKEKATRAPIAHEGRKSIAAGGPKNTIGVLAMARTGDPHSASSQFFINVVDNPFLDPVPIPAGDPVKRFEYNGRVLENVPRAKLEQATQLFGYTTFGKVISGMATVETIRNTPTGSGGPFDKDVPVKAVVIQSAVLVSAGK